MQQSLIYNAIKNFPYPFIVRHDRQKVYTEHKEMDYMLLWKHSLRLSIVGYIVGKFIKLPWTMAMIAPLPLIVKFLYQEYNLKKQGKYQQIYKFQNQEIKKKIEQIQKIEKEKQAIQQKHMQIQTGITLKQNCFGQNILSIKQYVKKLPNDYF